MGGSCSPSQVYLQRSTVKIWDVRDLTAAVVEAADEVAASEASRCGPTEERMWKGRKHLDGSENLGMKIRWERRQDGTERRLCVV